MRRSLILLALATALDAQAPDVPAPAACAVAARARAEQALDAGWTHWRAGRIADAESSFRAAQRHCDALSGPYVGLGYIALRRDALPTALARFDSAARRTTAPDFDRSVGEGLAHFRLGEIEPARAAFGRAQSILPGDASVREYLRRLPSRVSAADLPTQRRPDSLQLAARTGRRILEVPDGQGGWRPLWVKAVNLGAALPGRHPSEFPEDDGTYEQWVRTMAELGANTVRVYTIHPPHFYRALAEWNIAHPDSTLWLIHGVWTELPPGSAEENYDDAPWAAQFLAEAGRVVDLLHGRAAISARSGHASGMYLHDVSRWTLGYILGREWEPYSVQAFAARHPTRTSYRGRYVELDGGNAVDVWLAQVADSMIAYETVVWNAQRPMAYTNWPTLDPLTHPTETSRAEEAAILARRRERPPEAAREYDNDVIGLDATRMRATDAFRGGLFASYHAYPYYPDFLVLDPGYASTVGPEGPSHYLGYLRALIARHGEMPVIISEYGVPSSRGVAHLQPQGWHHGGHDEAAQARINARLTREIAASGAAGAGLFALIDEWFKKNWLVIDFEQPAERNRLWLNVLDPEQLYGVIAMRAGVKDSALVIDGARDDWRGRAPHLTRPAAAAPVDASARVDALWVAQDEAYVYLRLDLGRVDFATTRYLIGIDTHGETFGDRQLPFGGARLPVGLEFVIDLNGPDDARVLVDSPYNLYRLAPILGAVPPALQQIYNTPFSSRPNTDGRFDTLVVTPNRRTFGRDGTQYPAQRVERNLLRHGRQSESTLVDWFADTLTGTIELRIPWGMLHVLDPSSHFVLRGMRGQREPDGITTPGFRFVVQSLPRDRARPGMLLTGAAEAALPPLWTWPGWDTPRWYAERKPLFEAMRETFRAIPDAGPPR